MSFFLDRSTVAAVKVRSKGPASGGAADTISARF